MHINTADIVGVVCEGRPNDMNMYYSYLVTNFVLPINDQQKVILLSEQNALVHDIEHYCNQIPNCYDHYRS